MHVLDLSRVAFAALVFAAVAPGASAATEVELDVSLLEYSKSDRKADLDDLTIEGDSTDIATVRPDIGIDLYWGHALLGINLDLSTDSQSGGVKGGYEVGSNVYVGLSLNIEQTKDNSETKSNGAPVSETDIKESSLIIGPFVSYRVKSSNSIIEAHAQIARYTNDETDADDDESTFEMLILEFGGDYFYELADRVYLGAGLSYTISLSGDASVEQNGVKQDGDFDLSTLSIDVAQLKVEL